MSTRATSANSATTENRVAVLVNCDKVKPDILEIALCLAVQFGQVVPRRDYGNHATLANEWKPASSHFMLHCRAAADRVRSRSCREVAPPR